MTIVFIDGSKIIHSYFAKVSANKSKNELYIVDNGEEFIYTLSSVERVDLEQVVKMTEEDLILFIQVLGKDGTGRIIKQDDAKAIADMISKKGETNDKRTH